MKKIIYLLIFLTISFNCFSQQNTGFKIELEDVYKVHNLVEYGEDIDVYCSFFSYEYKKPQLAIKRISVVGNKPKSISDAVRMNYIDNTGAEESLYRKNFLPYSFRNGKYINSKIYSTGYYGLAEIETFNIKNQEGFIIDLKGNLFKSDDFEINNGNTIETFDINAPSYHSYDWSAYLAKSTYNNMDYLFIEKLGLNNKVKIDITENNSFVTHREDRLKGRFYTGFILPGTNSFVNVVNLSGYWRINGKDLVAISGTAPTYSHWTFYYLINNGKVEKIIYDANQINPPNPVNGAKPQIFFLDSSKTIIEIKEGYLIQAFDFNGKKLWSSKLKGFTMINDIVEINNKIIVGGASDNVGYVGYNNPFLQILDLNTGSLLSQNQISQKYASVNNMLVSGEDVYISTGYFEDNFMSHEEPFKTVSSLIIRENINEKGEFVNNLFNNKESINLNKIQPRLHGKCEGNCEDGKGTFYFTNGDKYEGNWKNRKRDGKGTYDFSNGEKYTGDWIVGAMTGKGIYYYSNGDRYEGDFIDGKFSGKGIKYTKNFISEGEFKDDKLNGHGVKKKIYEGVVKIWREGQFKNDLLNGYGKLYGGFSGGELYYEGELLNGNPYGKGIKYERGNRYEGNFDGNRINGKGVLVFENGDRYEGDFVSSRMIGNGIYYYMDGRKYIGEFSNNKFHGYGEMFDKDGNLLKKGQFVNGEYVED